MQTENENNQVRDVKHVATGMKKQDEQTTEVNTDLAADIQIIKDELEQAEQERDDFKDRYMRSMADLENLRKRFDRERSDLLKYGHEKVLSDLLPVLDSFDKALASDKSSGESYAEGVKLVHRQLFDVLEKHGLKTVEAVGRPFDPNVHQGIQRIETDVGTEMVRDEFQKGYLLNERLIRPAVVSVAVPEKSNKDRN
jgi:molecular chaperone GrpE